MRTSNTPFTSVDHLVLDQVCVPIWMALYLTEQMFLSRKDEQRSHPIRAAHLTNDDIVKLMTSNPHDLFCSIFMSSARNEQMLHSFAEFVEKVRKRKRRTIQWSLWRRKILKCTALPTYRVAILELILENKSFHWCLQDVANCSTIFMHNIFQPLQRTWAMLQLQQLQIQHSNKSGSITHAVNMPIWTVHPSSFGCYCGISVVVRAWGASGSGPEQEFYGRSRVKTMTVSDCINLS